MAAEDLAGALHPYSSAAPFMGNPPSWIVDPLDALRVQSYLYYEALYSGAPDFYEVNVRGDNEAPVYVPSARIIIEAINRYVAPEFKVGVKSLSGAVTESPDLTEAADALARLLARERFYSRFAMNKRQGLKLGDMLWHVTADPEKPSGSRLRITAIDPGMYFKIFDEDDVDRVIGCHLVEQVEMPKGTRIRRQTYRKYIDGEGDAARVTITVEEAIFTLDEWGKPDGQGKAEQVTRPEEELPETITALPVYHIPNAEEVGNPYGKSELAGLERIMNALSQAMSDQDLTLAMAGLGQWVYVGEQPTDDGTPSGNPVPFRFGPGVVTMLPGGQPDDLKHISGATSVQPYEDHIKRLTSFLMQAAAVPDIAVGEVGAAAAESGVARMLKFAPLLARADEKNVAIIDVHNQMFHDILNGWFPAYEGMSWDDVTANCTVGSALPIDRSEILGELKQLLADGVIDTVYYRERLKELGYTFPDDLAQRVRAERDEFAARSATELGDDGGDVA